MRAWLHRLSLLVANLCWVLAGLPAWIRFRLGREDVAATQASVLRRLLAWNRDSAYGRKYEFRRIRNVDDYRRLVPLVEWSDLEPWVHRICQGEQGLLSEAPVLMVEPTSGTSSRAKYVPYTKALRGEFQEAVGAWIVDLYLHHPRLFLGSAYWCVTPLTARERRTEGGLAVGFEEEGEYFGPIRQWLLRTLLKVPKEIALVESPEAFRYATLLFLLAAEDLALISIWSPTFLSTLLAPLAGWIDRLADDLEAGRLSPPMPMAEALVARLSARLGTHVERAREIRRIVEIHGKGEGLAQALWPDLVLVSAWADGAAADWVPPLRRLFPAAAFQPKGLLSTEGITTIPLCALSRGAALAVHAQFYEFLDEDDRGQLAHELETGKVYESVLSTGGGLYRYRTGDRVRVEGKLGDLPLLSFVGRRGGVVDHFGEKLTEDFLREALRACEEELELDPPPFRLVALTTEEEPRYCVWWTERSEVSSSFSSSSLSSSLSSLPSLLDTKLRANPHYDHCRRLGQLGPLTLRLLEPGVGWDRYLARCLAEGMREGDVKPRLLDPRKDWERWFVHPS